MKPPPYLSPLSETKQGNPQSRDQGRAWGASGARFFTEQREKPHPDTGTNLDGNEAADTTRARGAEPGAQTSGAGGEKQAENGEGRIPRRFRPSRAQTVFPFLLT